MEYKKLSPVKNPITEQEKQFIRDNHEAKTVVQIADELNRHSTKIYEIMREEGLTTLDTYRANRKVNKKRVPENCFDVDSQDWAVG